MSNNKLDYGALLKSNFELYTKSDNMVPLLVGGLIAAIGSGLTLGILVGPLFLGLHMMAIAVANGEKIEIGDISKGFQHFVPSFLLMLMIGVGVMVGMILLVIPGLIFAFLCTFSMQALAVSPESGPVEAIKTSVNMVKDNLVDVLVIAVIAGALNTVLSSVSGGLLGIVVMPFVILLMTRAFLELGGASAASAAARGTAPSAL